MLNILIACDHKPSRENFTQILAAEPYFHVMMVCADTHAAVTITGSEKPDIVFIDGSSDPLAAIEATKRIVAFSAAGVVAFSRQADASFAQHMMAAGALGYLGGKVSAEEIITAITEVAKDNLYCSLETANLPVQTPQKVSAFKKAIAALGAGSRKTVSEVVGSHWHGILTFTN